MSVHGAEALRPHAPIPATRRAKPPRRLALGLGLAMLATTAAVGAGMVVHAMSDHGLASRRTAENAPAPRTDDAARSVQAERVAHLRVVAPPVRTAPRVHHARAAAAPAAPRSDGAAARHPRLFAAPELAEASSFASAAPVRIAGFEAPTTPVAEPAASTSEAPTLIVEAEPASASSPILPANAEEALEAALVPTPRARPAYRTIMSAPPRAKPAAPLLAYARPDAGRDEDDDTAGPKRSLFRTPSVGNGVAIYDIGAATVYMPNGERLEAHSGLGSLRDDARFVHVKNRGPTPPHTYDLRLRESLFHGVQAIRLTPVGGERQIHNRNGLLAHTYMLGRKGDSNGCVSFKDYKRFLAAFRRGEVRRLVVVKRLDPVSRLASLFGRG